jgi:mannitol/fructose-specific phosphotransferase system IIA component (Ntr-type)
MRSILTALQEGRLFELADTGKARAFEFLARILDANPDIEVGTDALEEVQLREQECNTGIGMGVGVPHIRAKREEGELYCAIGWSAKGIDYGAEDGKPVHLVFMYYIPGAQKNVYLKEISGLVKAVRKTGGIEPIAHAEDLNAVRNLLLDWVSEVLGDTGPEAVARMIKLEVKHAQGAPAPAYPQAAPDAGVFRAAGATAFAVLVADPGPAIVLSPDPDLASAIEKDGSLAANLAGGKPFKAGGREVYVTAKTAYAKGRAIYQCIALVPA